MYLSSFLVVAYERNLSLQDVISNSGTFKLGFGGHGDFGCRCCSKGCRVYLGVVAHALVVWEIARARDRRSHDDTVFSGVCSLSFPAFMSVKHLVVVCASNVLAIEWTSSVRSISAEVVYVFICAR